MSHLLIRDVPDDVVAARDARAARLGLARNEYIRRRLAQDARAARVPVTTADLRRFADTYRDLGDADVMERAWQ